MPRFSRSRFRREGRKAGREIAKVLNKQIDKVNTANEREVKRHNRRVRAHNARVRSNQRRRLNEISRLNSRNTTTARYVTYHTSMQTLQQSFAQIETASEEKRWTADDDLFEMAEGEAANSAAVLNALLDDPTADRGEDARLRDTIISSELQEISPELDHRWSGALFSLSPMNRDAARQFCTSAREILVNILDVKAPDMAVLAAKPDLKRINGQVPRREKIYYCLAQSGQQTPELVDFVADDINNVMDLFSTLNPATHGEAGLYDFSQLRAIKTRVEGAIQFLHRVVSY